MGKIADALQILQRIMEYKIASRDIYKSALKTASDSEREQLAAFHEEQILSLTRIPTVFRKLKFDSPTEITDDSVTEMMEGIFIEAAAGDGGDLDFRKAALRVEEKAIQIMKKPLVEHSLHPDVRSLLEECLLTAEIHVAQLKKMTGL